MSRFYKNMPNDFKKAVEVIKEYCQNEDCMENCAECSYPLGIIRCGDMPTEDVDEDTTVDIEASIIKQHYR